MRESINNYYINARVAQLSNRLFGMDKYNRLAESANLSSAIKVLHEVQFGGAADNLDTLLNNELNEAVSLLRQLCKNPNESNFFLLTYSYHNAKVLAKCKYGRLDETGLCFDCASIPVATMKEQINKDDYSSLPREMAQALSKIDEEFANGNRSPQLIDVLLDRAMFAQMQQCAKKSRIPALKDYCEFTIDAVNIMLLFRCKKNKLAFSTEDFIGGGRLNDMLTSVASKEAQDIVESFYLHEYQPLVRLCAEGVEQGSLKKAQYYISQRKLEIISKNVSQETAQPLLVYFTAKLAEIERVRFILICIKYGTDKDAIKDMLANV